MTDGGKGGTHGSFGGGMKTHSSKFLHQYLKKMRSQKTRWRLPVVQLRLKFHSYKRL